MLGVPRESEPDILRLTNQLFASDDPDLQRQGEDRQQSLMALGMELFQLFSGIIQDRRANPRDDLASLLANAQIDGKPMGPMETLGYFLITFTAGHDTTKNSIAGGMRALDREPGPVRRGSRARPGAARPRPWRRSSASTTPVNFMKRTA